MKLKSYLNNALAGLRSNHHNLETKHLFDGCLISDHVRISSGIRTGYYSNVVPVISCRLSSLRFGHRARQGLPCTHARPWLLHTKPMATCSNANEKTVAFSKVCGCYTNRSNCQLHVRVLTQHLSLSLSTWN